MTDQPQPLPQLHSFRLALVGIGSGNPEHLTLQAQRVLRSADLVLVPRKGAGKEDLAGLRLALLDAVLGKTPEQAATAAPERPRIATFDMPSRDPATPDYRQRVADWHDAIAQIWAATIADDAARHGPAARVALMVWGDPALYDSTLRIAARLQAAEAAAITIESIPGITAIQALCASHAIALNSVGGPFTVTTGRNLRAGGWPDGAETLVVMLDGEASFTTLPPEGLWIWWTAYAGMAEEIRDQGPLAEAGPRILAARQAARNAHGWIMDIYLLRRQPQA